MANMSEHNSDSVYLSFSLLFLPNIIYTSFALRHMHSVKLQKRWDADFRWNSISRGDIFGGWNVKTCEEPLILFGFRTFSVFWQIFFFTMNSYICCFAINFAADSNRFFGKSMRGVKINFRNGINWLSKCVQFNMAPFYPKRMYTLKSKKDIINWPINLVPFDEKTKLFVRHTSNDQIHFHNELVSNRFQFDYMLDNLVTNHILFFFFFNRTLFSVFFLSCQMKY